eukprot:c14230_g1_i1.p1 GENE.c14230_g1_i1~~c14230_g1_i1.p1  ORF type:complete len:155 (+),score=14.80 c14230_g1_i1:38-502(+)
MKCFLVTSSVTGKSTCLVCDIFCASTSDLNSGVEGSRPIGLRALTCVNDSAAQSEPKECAENDDFGRKSPGNATDHGRSALAADFKANECVRLGDLPICHELNTSTSITIGHHLPVSWPSSNGLASQKLRRPEAPSPSSCGKSESRTDTYIHGW